MHGELIWLLCLIEFKLTQVEQSAKETDGSGKFRSFREAVFHNGILRIFPAPFPTDLTVNGSESSGNFSDASFCKPNYRKPARNGRNKYLYRRISYRLFPERILTTDPHKSLCLPREESIGSTAKPISPEPITVTHRNSTGKTNLNILLISSFPKTKVMPYKTTYNYLYILQKSIAWDTYHT